MCHEDVHFEKKKFLTNSGRKKSAPSQRDPPAKIVIAKFLYQNDSKRLYVVSLHCWRWVFVLSLPYAHTRPCGPKVFLLLRALASPSTSAVVCACMAQGPWIVAQLPTASGNTVLQPSWRPSDDQQISWVPTCRATIRTGAGSTHTWRATERRLHFDSPTRTRVNSDLSVNDGYCFRLFSVATSPLTYFSPFPSRTLPRSTRTMTDSGQLRSSISLLGNHAEFLLSRSTSALNTLQASHALWFLLEETETSTNGQKLKSFLTLDRRSVSPHRPACVRALRGQWEIWLAPRLSLATESTGTVLIPSQMSEIAGHVTFP